MSRVIRKIVEKGSGLHSVDVLETVDIEDGVRVRVNNTDWWKIESGPGFQFYVSGPGTERNLIDCRGIIGGSE